MNLGKYRLDLDQIMQNLIREILSVLLGSYTPTDDQEEKDRQIAEATPIITEHVRVARNRAHRVAVQQLLDSTPKNRIPYIPDQRGYARDAVETVLKKEFHGPAYDVGNRVSSTLVRHAEQAARDTIVDAAIDDEWKTESEEEPRPSREDETSTEDEGIPDEADREPGRSRLRINFGPMFDEDEELEDELREAMNEQRASVRPIGWARIMTGAETCAFCVMLASRPGSGERRFYTSADAAGGELATMQYRGTSMFVNRYHNHCDCIVVPIYDENNWIGREQADYLYEKVYLPAVGGKPVSGWRSNKYAENDVIKMLEKWLKEHEDDFALPALREMV